MAENKTRPTSQTVSAFVEAIAHDQRRKDCRELLAMMRRATGKPAAMWGTSIIGFGQYHYRYESGREGDFFVVGLAPRKQSLVVYITPGFSDHGALLDRLGKHKTGKSCLYINRLDDVDREVLAQLVDDSVAEMRRRYPGCC